MREWDIPYDELKIEEPIGKGRFGTVYRGNWHGDVAVRVLNMDHYDQTNDDDQTLEAFKLEVFPKFCFHYLLDRLHHIF